MCEYTSHNIKIVRRRENSTVKSKWYPIIFFKDKII